MNFQIAQAVEYKMFKTDFPIATTFFSVNLSYFIVKLKKYTIFH